MPKLRFYAFNSIICTPNIHLSNQYLWLCVVKHNNKLLFFVMKSKENAFCGILLNAYWVLKKLLLTERISSPQEMHQQHKEASTYMNYGGVRNGASTHSLRHNPSQVGIDLGV